MTEIDGSIGEAGGQILRTATALAAVTKKPCRVFNIRRGREKPGLMPQHLLGIQNVAKLCNGYLEGDKIGSEEIKFYPGEIIAKDLHIRIETAGSITLLLQSLLPLALFASQPIKITFKGGGTDVPFSPTIDHFRYVFLKILEKMGVKAKMNILKRGFYPTGEGEVKVEVFSTKLKPLNLTERGNFEKIEIFSVTSEFLKEKKVAERQARAAEEIFKKLKLPIETKVEYFKTDCPGSSICIISKFSNTVLGSDGLGKLGVSAEEIGKKAAIQLLEEGKSNGCIDRFLTDQILIYLALSKQECQIRIPQLTLHARTNIWTIQKFMPGKFEIKNNIIKWIPE